MRLSEAREFQLSNGLYPKSLRHLEAKISTIILSCALDRLSAALTIAVLDLPQSYRGCGALAFPDVVSVNYFA